MVVSWVRCILVALGRYILVSLGHYMLASLGRYMLASSGRCMLVSLGHYMSVPLVVVALEGTLVSWVPYKLVLLALYIPVSMVVHMTVVALEERTLASEEL